MKRQTVTLLSACIALIALTVTGIAPRALIAQIDPTTIAETNAAAVQGLFDQTGTAVATRTAELYAAQTATAQSAPTQTIAALFSAAQTATAVGVAPDYSDYRLRIAQELDLLAAPGRTGAHLSPDGTLFVHLDGGDVCLYRLAEQWTEDRCFELDRQQFRGTTDELFWSPDGRYLSLGTYVEGLQFLRDTDIRVLDTETGAILNLTDDNFDDDLLSEYRGNFDLAPRWLDADTLVFIRYASIPTADSEASLSERLLPPAIYSVDVSPSAEPTLLTAIPSPYNLPIYVLAAQPRLGRIAFTYDTRGEDMLQGIWTGNIDGTDLAARSSIRELRDLPLQLDFSADGRYLLGFGADDTGRPTMQVFDAETGERIEIDPDFPTRTPDGAPLSGTHPVIVGAGWSPRGAALIYIVRDILNEGVSGVYLTETPGTPGRQLLPGDYFGTTCCGRHPITWASNDMILIGRGAQPGVLLIQLGAD
jgi:hypothetical protein